MRRISRLVVVAAAFTALTFLTAGHVPTTRVHASTPPRPSAVQLAASTHAAPPLPSASPVTKRWSGHQRQVVFYPPLPPGSGEGRRIVYSNGQQRVWLVEDTGRVSRSYLVSGRRGVPRPATYTVFSKSPWTQHPPVEMEWMVRFVDAPGYDIGFHGIPHTRGGSPIQSEAQLGTYRSLGCVRQKLTDARHLYDWAPVGTKVVVV